MTAKAKTKPALADGAAKDTSQKKPKQPDKAGLVIMGVEKGSNVVSTLISYSQGKYTDDGEKVYGLTKGSREEGEGELQAAARETKEETGIDLVRLLGEENYERFAAGKPIKAGKSGYLGVSIRLADPSQAQVHTYYSSALKRPNPAKPGKEKEPQSHRVKLYPIIVDGIENLRPFLKRPPVPTQSVAQAAEDAANGNRSTFLEDETHLKLTAKEYLKEAGYPRFKDRLHVLRTGDFPPRHPLPEGVTGILEKQSGSSQNTGPKTAFAAAEESYLAKGLLEEPIETRQELAEFVKMLKYERDPHLKHFYDRVREDIVALGDFMKDQKLAGGKLPVKMDEKEHPLTLFFEGAEILPINVVMQRMIHQATRIPEIAARRLGMIELPEEIMSFAQRFAHSQLGAEAKVFGSVRSTLAAAMDMTSERLAKWGGKYQKHLGEGTPRMVVEMATRSAMAMRGNRETSR